MERSSICLSHVLDSIGMSNSIRQRIKEINDMNNACREIILLTKKYSGKMYYMDSFPESTYRVSLKSDIDILCIFYNIPVIELCNSNETYSLCMFSDKEQYPGYVKLALEGSKGNPPELQFPIKKCDGRQLLVNQLKESFQMDLFGDAGERHGPAVQTMDPDNTDIDNVYGFQCTNWPSVAAEWPERMRPNNWPTRETLRTLIKLPCFVVPIGAKGSSSEQFEWRVSFNMQEQHLMINLNDTQYKCFMLLKYIKETFARKAVGEGFSSYHCKTAAFYMIEKHGQNMCKPERLLDCFIRCIHLLLTWCEEGHCPSFFIPACNLFRGKLNESGISKLSNLMKAIHSRPFDYISRIEYDHIGQLFAGNITEEDRQKFEADALNSVEVSLTANLVDAASYITACMHSVSEYIYLNHGIKQRMSIVSESGIRLEEMRRVIGHHFVMFYQISILYNNNLRNESKKHVFGSILSGIETSLASHLVVMAIQEPRYRVWYIVTSALYFWRTFAKGYIPGLIKLACVTYMMGYTDSCRFILSNINNNFDDGFFYTGAIYSQEKLDNDFAIFSHDAILENSPQHLFHDYFSEPVHFSSGELLITPNALKLEMFRSIASPRVGPLERIPFWHACAVVDSRTFYRFLCWQTGLIQESLMSFVTKELEYRPQYRVHHETRLNMLTWLAKQHGHTQLALQLCEYSIRFLKQCMEKLLLYYRVEDFYYMNNAAKIHATVLVFELWNKVQQR